MITQEFLSQCSDDQVNRGVAWLRFCGIVEVGDNWKDFINLSDIPKKPNWPKYCSNPITTMPIAFANKIDITHSKTNTGQSYASNCGIQSVAKNNGMLRAICEVYILMSVKK